MKGKRSPKKDTYSPRNKKNTPPSMIIALINHIPSTT